MRFNIVVMGVAGCGKSSVAEALAHLLGYRYLEGDAYHLPGSIAKMRAGTPLTDEDRWPWLRVLVGLMRNIPEPVVLSCSALRRSYRDELLRAGRIIFIHLDGKQELIERRMAARDGHFMPSSLLDSQFAILEPPQADEESLTVGIEQLPDEIVSAVV